MFSDKDALSVFVKPFVLFTLEQLVIAYESAILGEVVTSGLRGIPKLF